MKQAAVLKCFLNVENDISSITDSCPRCDRPQTAHTTAQITKGKDLAPFLSRVSTMTRDIDIEIPSVRPSVCLSVTRRYQMKTA